MFVKNVCLIRFNPLKMLEMLRDKRIMFIGDSIQRGMFESMVCLVHSVIADVDHPIERVPPRKIFRIEVLMEFTFHLNLCVHKSLFFCCRSLTRRLSITGLLSWLNLYQIMQLIIL